MIKRAVLSLGVCLLAAGAGLAAQKAQTAKTTFRAGYVMDAKCAPMGMKMATNEACIKKCVAGGSKLVLYDNYTKKIYQLDPQSAVAEHASHHVRVYGTVDGDTIHVTSVKMIMAKTAAKPAS
ncbi:MAG TPA: hypothetical protein VGR81_07045 [Candidatus Acidoferrales bacterium]|nr:hypothetical protein [Candidatus Acidoferrales bacterium]